MEIKDFYLQSRCLDQFFYEISNATNRVVIALKTAEIALV